MINGKLKKPVSALTQADIDNETTKSGTVSGEQLAALGGGGVEVLKDWTTTTALDSNLFGGVDSSGIDLNDVYIEFKNVKGSGGGGSAIDDYINLQFRNSGGTVIEVGKKSSKGILAISAGSGTAGGSDDRFSVFAASFGVFNGKGRVDLMTNPALGISGYVSDTIIQNNEPSLLGSQYMKVIASFYNVADEPPSELWLHGVDAAGLDFTATYRIMKTV